MALLSSERLYYAVLRRNRKWKVTTVKVVQNKKPANAGFTDETNGTSKKGGIPKSLFLGRLV
jgi:hypothetical protein